VLLSAAEMARDLAAASSALVLLLLIGSAFGDYAMVNEPYGVTTVGDATFYGDQQGNGVDGEIVFQTLNLLLIDDL
jgi:hypothetical protein